MPKPKWNLNTIYISERLQESLRPISRCAMTTVVAPMGYGKTTAVEWYLAERARAEAPYIVRISVYSGNLAIFWKSVQDAFARAGFAFLREYDCPTDGASGGLLIDDLCHALTGEKSCYIFIDDFHLLTDKRAPGFLCALAGRLPPNVHLILASRDLFLPAAELVRLGGKVYQIGTAQLRLNHTELAVYTKRCGTALSDEQIDTLLYYSEGWFSAVYLNLRMFSEHGVLPDPNSDISSIFTAAMIDPLPEKQREFLAVMGLADEFTVEMAQFVMADAHAEDLLAALTGQNAFVKRLPDGVTYRFHHMMKECALHTFLSMPKERQTVYRGRLGIWYEDHRLYLHAMIEYRQNGDYDAAHAAEGCRHSAFLAAPEGSAGSTGRMPGSGARKPSAGDSGAYAEYVQLAQYPENAGAEGAAADGDFRKYSAFRTGKRRFAGRMRPDHEFSLLQRYQRHEPPAPECQRADVAEGDQHPVRRRLDLRLAVCADDVLPRTG